MTKTIHPFSPEDLMAYFDDELVAERAAATKAHLSTCAECKELAESFGNVSDRLRAWKIEPKHENMPPTIASALLGTAGGPRSISLATRLRKVFSARTASFAWVATAAVGLIAFVITTTHTGKKSVVVDNTVVLSKATGLSDYSADTRSASSRDRLQVPQSAPDSHGAVSPLPLNGRNVKQLVQLQPGAAGAQQQDEKGRAANAPMIIRTAQLSLITKDFDKTRANLDSILHRHQGYFGDLSSTGNPGSGRSLSAVLRVPADQLDAAMAEVKALGRVLSESQGGQDVTAQYVDLEARLGNSRQTEQRLADLLRNRTGKLSDVLEVEQEISRVRGEIEQMEAERKNLSKQVSYATLSATITEDYKAELEVVPPSTPTRLANAAIDGYRSMVDGIVSLALFLLSTAPTLILWGGIIFLLCRLIWRKVASVEFK